MRKGLALYWPLIEVISLLVGIGCGSDSKVVSSRAYKGHENDRDTNSFVAVYAKTVDTRLDDCQTCHTGGIFTISGKTSSLNVCDYCHLVQHPERVAGYTAGTLPTSYAGTLNPYGTAYLAAGRTQQALRDIASADSDGDGSANGAEIDDLKYPGNAASKPGQPTVPLRAYTFGEIQALASHSEFLLANSQKQQYDYYATYTGVKLKDLLLAAGVDPTDPNITGLFVSAPDGFVTSVKVADVNAQLPDGTFHAGLDTATLGTTCGFVQYPAALPAGLTDGATIPDEQWVMLAYARDGLPLDTAAYDYTSGKINGEGPYRLVVPQSTPGKPDRGQSYNGDPWATQCTDNYVSNADHNAGKMARGVVAIRIEPLPSGYEDFDYLNGGWSLIEDDKLVVYGYGIH